MGRSTWDFDFRETALKNYYDIEGDSDLPGVSLHRIGTWYASKMHDHYCLGRVRSGRSRGEYFFGW